MSTLQEIKTAIAGLNAHDKTRLAAERFAGQAPTPDEARRAVSLHFAANVPYAPGMNTLAEIEAAAVTLSPAERKQLEDFLRELRVQAEEAHLQEIYHRVGLHPLPKRGGPPVTVELVRQICEEEGL